MVNAIDEVTLSIAEGETAIMEYAQSIQEIEWEVFDMIQEQISDVTKEADFLIELMSNKKLYNEDNGQLTDEGKATMGLHGQNYNTNMYQADKYAEEIKKLDQALKSDPFDQDLINRRRELLELQQESILAAEDEKNAIKDMVEEGIELELEALEELIDKYTEALETQQDLYEYQQKVVEATEDIAALEKQLSALAGDDSEENRAKLQELKDELQSSKDDLAELEYDQFISDQKRLLDELYLEYETILNARLDNIDVLIAEMIAQINADASVINTTITTAANDVGYTLSETIKQTWNTSASTITNGISNVITTYGDKFTNAQTTTNNALNSISKNVISMISQLNKLAETNVSAASVSSAARPKPAPSKPSTPSKSSSSSGGDGTPKVGDKVKFTGGTYYYDSYGMTPSGSKYAGQYVYITNINKKGSKQYHISRGNKLGNGDLGWLTLAQLSGYATGKKTIDENEIAWTQENGAEIIVRPSDGAILTPLAKGDSVLNAAATSNIWDMANSPADFIRENLSVGNVGAPIEASSYASYTQNIDNVSFVMPNVKNYQEMISAMKKDKNFQRLVESMSVDKIAGKSSLRKGKAIR